MSKIGGSLRWVSDITRSLIIDRFNPLTRRNAELASTACREYGFHSRARIRQEPLRDILGSLGCSGLEPVLLPGAGADLGQCGSRTAYHVLGSLVGALRPELIFETGTYLGVSALTMALNTPENSRIYTLDLPESASPEATAGLNSLDKTHVETSRFRLGEAFLESSLRGKIHQLRDDSMNFRAESLLKGVDFAHIDGGHSFDLIRMDTENALRVLSTQGAILWDDYFHLYPDVVTYLDELSETMPLRGIEGTNYVLYSAKWHRPVPESRGLT